MKLRLLEAGRFEMGENDLGPGFYKDHSEFNVDDVRPVHPVVLTRPFYLATTEVTVGQFRQFVEGTGYVTSAEKNPRGAVGWVPTPPVNRPNDVSTFRDDGGFHWKQPGFEQQDDHPVVCVSHADATAYCRWLSDKEGIAYRLPTEAEWEYAARGGTETFFSFGNAYRGVIQRHANIGNVELEKAFPDRVRRQWLIDIERDPADQHVFTAPVGSYEANPWGLFDLYGNVWEWCEDRYLDTAYAPYTRPAYQQLRKKAVDPFIMEKSSDVGDWRVIRGGSWFNAPIQCRSSVRGYFEAADAGCYLGFRIACTAAEELVTAARARFEQSEAALATLQRLADRVRERRDGRLSVEHNHQQKPVTEEFLSALEQLDEPVDLYIHGQLTPALVAGLTKTRHLAGFLVTDVGPDLKDADFAGLGDHPELELLQISRAPNLTDGLLEHLRQHHRLESLSLDSPGITDNGLLHLPALEHLHTLVLSATAVEGPAFERFRKSPLRTLSCSHLTDEGVRQLAPFTQLREVSLAGSPITGRGLAEIARLPWVTQLFLADCQNLNDADFAVLGDLYELRTLHLDRTAAGDAALEGLARLNDLSDLHIGSEHLSDAGLKNVCSIVSLNSLIVTEQAANVTDAGLTDLWRLVNLRSLSIGAPQVSGSGLATLHELPRLDWLQLNGTGVGDDALKYAARSSTLQRMFVGSWQTGAPKALTDDGLLQLAESRSLTQFDLIRRDTQVTDAAVQTLRQRRPQLNVNLR